MSSVNSIRLLLCSLVVLSACSDREPPPDEDAGQLDAAAVDAPSGDDVLADDAGTDGGTDAGTDAGPLTGETYVYVLDFMDVAAAEEGGDPAIVPGFDLDDRVSAADDLETCRREDFTSPAPDNEPGVDNRLGPTLASQEEMLHVRSNLIGNVRLGNVLVLLEVRGVDDFVNDDRVEVDVLFGLLPEGVEMPMLMADFRYVPGQTFDLDPRSFLDDGTTIRVSLAGRIVDGRLDAGPGSLTLTVPFEMDTVELDLKRVRSRFDISETGLARGVIGGSLDVEETAMRLAEVTEFDAATLEIILNGSADLDRIDGRCRSVSIGLVFDGTTAVKGLVR